MKYDHIKIEKKWRVAWAKNKKLYAADEKSSKLKYYVLDMFPYPSGEGLHAGHPLGYTATDITARFMRMNGYNVLHPMGWDAFGLPAENFAIKNKVHPAIVTKRNIANFKRQIQSLGFSYDWSREINTTDPEYYKWTQWIFLKLFEKGLAYEAELPINFCPSCKTGLANEEVVDGACERCGTQVVQKKMRQWVLKITEYADRLLADLDGLDWPEKIKAMQRNWIGRSEGAEIVFKLKVPGQPDMHTVTVFTTRPDTLFGATFVAIAPELAQKWLSVGWQASEDVKKFITDEQARAVKADRAEDTEKRGVFSGVMAVNPANGKEIPVWVVNYVLGDVGTGAIMAVPAHDQRDFEFAKQFNLPIQQVIMKQNTPIKSYLMGAEDISDEDLVNLGIKIVGKESDGDRKVIIPKNSIIAYEKLIKDKMTAGFWNEYVGEQIVFIFKHKDERIERLVLGVENEKYIDKLAAQFIEGGWTKSCVWKWLAENNWYTDLIIHANQGFLANSGKFDGMESEKAKKAITEFVGGTMTVKYKLRDWIFSRQRYWGEPIPIIRCPNCGNVPLVEKDLPLKLPNVKNYEPTGTGESPLAAIEKWVNVKCPTCKAQAQRETNTMPQWAGSCWYYLRYIDPKNKKALVDPKKEKKWMAVDLYVGGAEHAVLHLLYARFWHKVLYDSRVVSTKEPFAKLVNQGMILGPNGVKMSKSKGNVVNPDDVVAQYGADVLRMYEMFMGQFEEVKAWDTKSIVGIRRFVERVYKLIQNAKIKNQNDKLKLKNDGIEKLLHKTIKKVTEDIQGFKFNTAISAMMVLLNEMEKQSQLSIVSCQLFTKLLAPFAPYLAEELWSTLGKKKSVHVEAWPQHDEKLTIEDEFDLVIQVNGKTRGTVKARKGISEEEAKTLAMREERIKNFITDGVKKTIFVKDRLINIIV